MLIFLVGKKRAKAARTVSNFFLWLKERDNKGKRHKLFFPIFIRKTRSIGFYFRNSSWNWITIIF